MVGTAMKQGQILTFSKRILTIVGGYGSGKSEVSVNLSRYLIESGQGPVAIADLDIVNPYFRSREAAEKLEELGIRTLNPKGEQHHADLPIILPEVKGAIQQFPGTVILDVGGDDAGARVLSSLADAFPANEYELFLVLNANRPFTADVASCQKMIEMIERSARLSFTGIISNTHLLENTTADTVMAGVELAHEVSQESGLPLVFVGALSDLVGKLDLKKIDVPVLPLRRWLVKPWEKTT